MPAQILSANEADEYYFHEGCFILELSNSAADTEVSIARAKVKTGVTTKLHRLRGVTERYVILAGNGRVEIGGLPAQTVIAGDVVIIPPRVSQRIANTGSEDLIFLAICSPRFTPDVYEDISERSNP